jgi:hypothetical protein
MTNNDDFFDFFLQKNCNFFYNAVFYNLPNTPEMNSWKEFELAGLTRVEIPEHPLKAEASPAFFSKIVHNTSTHLRIVSGFPIF